MTNAAFATVTEVSGLAWVRHADGSVFELRPGIIVPTPSDIITASGASVTLSIHGAAPFVIGESRSVAITEDLATPVEPAQAAVRADTPALTHLLAAGELGNATVGAEMTDSDRLLTAMPADDAPLQAMETTDDMAGGSGGNDGSGRFVRLLDVIESTTPLDLVYPSVAGGEGLLRLNGMVVDSMDAVGGIGVSGGGGDTGSNNILLSSILLGGLGDDTLYGSAGDDIFLWKNGDAGTVGAPAHDVVKDFGLDGSDPNKGSDTLDLSDLLQGEDSDNVFQYLNFSYDGDSGHTTILASSTGNLQTTGIDATGYDQVITLENVDLTYGITDQHQLALKLINDGKLVIGD